MFISAAGLTPASRSSPAMPGVIWGLTRLPPKVVRCNRWMVASWSDQSVSTATWTYAQRHPQATSCEEICEVKIGQANPQQVTERNVPRFGLLADDITL